MNDRKAGIITSGVSALYVKEVYPEASFLTLGMSYPFPSEKVREFARSVEKLYVVEELEPFLEEMIRREGISVTGKKASWLCGELGPQAVKDIMTARPRRHCEKSAPPLLCPGCPHRPAFYTLKKRCLCDRRHRMLYPGRSGAVGSATNPDCMGSSIPFFEGVSKMQKDKKSRCCVGDSTFYTQV
jgi:indolepyruvate ferredoxin oxidoreductase alpha subunit